ncbi:MULTISPECIES: hypothetical protein [unclassified Psychrobacter]|nr:hypothetical protein [Psychrobacter sp. P11F6]
MSKIILQTILAQTPKLLVQELQRLGYSAPVDAQWICSASKPVGQKS